MTLSELWQLIRRYWFVVVGLPVLFVVVLVVETFLTVSSASYTATSLINVNSQLPFVSGLAANEVNNVQNANPGVSVKVKSDTAQMTISVMANGPSAELAESCANEITQNVVAKAESIFSGANESGSSIPFFAEAHEAGDADKDKKHNTKYLLIAVLSGLLVGICVLVLIDAVRRPVKGVRDATEATGLSCLGELPSPKGGERLLANLSILSEGINGGNNRWCFIPAKAAKDALIAAEAIQAAATAKGESVSIWSFDDGRNAGESDSRIQIECCEGLATDISGVYAAQKSNIVVVIIRMWTDSQKDLDACMQELNLAEAKVAGFVAIK